MARLTWNAIGERYYETGVNRGVLYVDAQPGGAWNGLTGVTENPSGGDAKPYYIDGVKYLNVPSSEEFGVSIDAFTYPNEFSQCDGTAVAFAGVSISQQRRKTFGLSYRTRIGNDIDGTQHGYKIHLIYNCLASPSERAYHTVDENADPIGFSWSCTTTPVSVGNGLRPTAHIVIDSTKITPQALEIVEGRLYGTDEKQSYLPSPAELFELFTLSPGILFRITLNTVNGLSVLIPDAPGDLAATLTDGLYVLTADSHLSGGSDDGTYIWED
jgi:hypothetical protein